MTRMWVLPLPVKPTTTPCCRSARHPKARSGAQASWPPRALNAEAKDQGVYAGAVTIGALIEGSASHAAMTASGTALNFPVISPDRIADEVWDLVTKRDRVEAVLPPMPAR